MRTSPKQIHLGIVHPLRSSRLESFQSTPALLSADPPRKLGDVRGLCATLCAYMPTSKCKKHWGLMVEQTHTTQDPRKVSVFAEYRGACLTLEPPT